MFKLGILCCLVVVCLAKEKRILFFGNSGSSGNGLTGGSGSGLTGGSGLLGGSGLMSSLPGLSSSGSGFLLGSFSNMIQQSTKYWTDLMSKLLGGGSASSGSGLTSLPGLSGLTGLSGLPGLSGGATGSLPTQTTALNKYNIDKSQISVSGLSAGAAFATQFHVIYSSDIMGAGIIAGLPFYCTSGGGVMTALTTCMQQAGEDLNSIESKTDQGATGGQIDPTSNLKNDKVYVFAGTADHTVAPANGPKIASFYQHYGVTNIKSVFNMAATHGQPTDNFGTACAVSNQQNFINNCGYNAAYDLLNFIYGGNLTKPSSGATATGEILAFDQSQYITSPASNGMDELGYVYVPTACKDGATQCKLHIAFHGCKQGRKTVGDAYVKHAGYNEVADLNNIIILYPQAQPSMMNGNPNGCFDWWGYAGNNFATKQGVQSAGVKKIMDTLTG